MGGEARDGGRRPASGEEGAKLKIHPVVPVVEFCWLKKKTILLVFSVERESELQITPD